MAGRLPKATVYAVDSNEDCLRVTRDAAALNDVKLVTGGNVTDLIENVDLIISDCEGYEHSYLDPEKYPGLAKVAMIVESHDFSSQHTTETLFNRFKNTHVIKHCISETARSPNDFDILAVLMSHTKWLAVSEGRPSTQYYLYMVPK